MGAREEELKAQIESLEKDPWNDEVERLRLQMVAKGVKFPKKDLWEDAEGFETFSLEEIKPFARKARNPARYELVVPGPIEKFLQAGKEKEVGVILEPEFGLSSKDNSSYRLMELRLTEKNIDTKTLKALLARYGIQIDQPLSTQVMWDISKKILLEQKTIFFPANTYKERKGVRLNNVVLSVSPRVYQELNAEVEEPQRLDIPLGEDKAKAVFHEILSAAEKAPAVEKKK